MELELVTEGLRFPEGPIAMADGLGRAGGDRPQDPDAGVPGRGGRRSSPSSAGARQRRRHRPGTAPATWSTTAGRSNSPTTGRKRAAWAFPTSYSGGSVQRVDLKTGAVSTLYDGCDGKPLNGPNDIVFDAAGGMWFTCFGFSGRRDPPPRRHLLRQVRRLEDRAPQVRADLAQRHRPLARREDRLYWTDSMLQRLWALDLTGPGATGPTPATPRRGWWSTCRGCSGSTGPGGGGLGQGLRGPPCSTAGSPPVDPATGAFEHTPFPTRSPPTSASAATTCATPGRPARPPASSTNAAGRGPG